MTLFIFLASYFGAWRFASKKADRITEENVRAMRVQGFLDESEIQEFRLRVIPTNKRAVLTSTLIVGTVMGTIISVFIAVVA